jgi:thioredoxin-dependent peroxiredoxin
MAGHGSVLRTGIATVAAVLRGIATLLFRPEPASRALEPGDVAPLFSLVGSDGRSYRLIDYRDRSAVVIAWFPKAFTSG